MKVGPKGQYSAVCVCVGGGGGSGSVWVFGNSDPDRRELKFIPQRLSACLQEKRVIFRYRENKLMSFISSLIGFSHLKGALSRYSVILCRFFFAVENGGGETRGRGAGQREARLFRTFFLHSSQLRDRSTSGYQSVTLAKSFLSR